MTGWWFDILSSFYLFSIYFFDPRCQEHVCFVIPLFYDPRFTSSHLFSRLSVQEMDEDPLNDQMIQTNPTQE